MARTIRLTIGKEQNGLPVRTVLTSVLSLSRHEISRLKFSEEGIVLNGEKVRVSRIVKENDELVITFPVREYGKAVSSFTPDIVYRDEDIIVINKPAGIVCHASHGHLEDDLGTALRAALDDSSLTVRTVGRLDKDVSGLVLYALNQPACARLSRERASGTLAKTYLAAAQGIFGEKSGTIRCFLKKEEGRRDRIISDEGKECVTSYRVIGEYGLISLLEVSILTGRTHQIRAAMASAGHPLAGDALYGGSTELIGRPALHCASLKCLSPFTGKEVSLRCPVPEDMNNLLKKSF